jgi:hypothetical protein
VSSGVIVSPNAGPNQHLIVNPFFYDFPVVFDYYFELFEALLVRRAGLSVFVLTGVNAG